VSNTKDEGSRSKRGFKFLVIFGALCVAAGLVIAYTTTVAVKSTSGVAFCSSCHSMKPMANSYLNSIHGGFGKSGFVAKCADCHLPHGSLIGYLFQKAKTGMHDVQMEITSDTYNIDWEEKREERRHFTYDNSCLHCHENLLRATKPNKKALLAHKAYFSGKLKIKIDKHPAQAMCVDCHKHVGHFELGKELDKIGTVYTEDYYNYLVDEPDYSAYIETNDTEYEDEQEEDNSSSTI